MTGSHWIRQYGVLISEALSILVRRLEPEACLVRCMDSDRDVPRIVERLRRVGVEAAATERGALVGSPGASLPEFVSAFHGFDDVWFGTAADLAGVLSGVCRLTSDALWNRSSVEEFERALDSMPRGLVGIGGGDIGAIVATVDRSSWPELDAIVRELNPDSMSEDDAADRTSRGVARQILTVDVPMTAMRSDATHRKDVTVVDDEAAASVIESVARRFVDDASQLWWWESLRGEVVVLDYAPTDGLELLERLLPADETLSLVITDDEPPPWLVVEGDARSLLGLLGASPLCECFFCDADAEWVVFDTHDNRLVVAGTLCDAARR